MTPKKQILFWDIVSFIPYAALLYVTIGICYGDNYWLVNAIFIFATVLSFISALRSNDEKIYLHHFLKTLDEYYENIPGTNLCLKYYLQVATFSYEIHDTDKQCFTKDSLVYESKTFWWSYQDKHRMESILKDIKANYESIHDDKVLRQGQETDPGL